MAKSQPINIRLDRGLEERLVSLARRTGESKSAIIAVLLDEAERSRRYTGLIFRGGERHRRASIAGSGWDVWEVIWALRGHDGHSAALVEASELHRADVDLARAYYKEFPEEIDRLIALNSRTATELRREYPLAIFSGLPE